MRSLLLVGWLLLAGGCAYYNGMYNTKRLAGRARKAEREGRPFEASSVWGQVAVKAESIVIRHPSKRWSDEARLLQGTALARTNACERALEPLDAVLRTSRRAELAEPAALLAGECRLRLDDPVGAADAFARLVDSRDEVRRSLARYHHGRALRIAGRHEAALAELASSHHPRAAGERAVALASGATADALSLVDSLIQARDTLAPWPEIAAALARRDPASASGLVDRLASDGGFPAPLRGRLLLDEARRQLRADPDGAERRLQQADSIARGTPVQAQVRLELARAIVSRVATVPDLREAIARLGDFIEEAGAFGAGGAELGVVARRVLLISDTVTPGGAGGDVRLFLAGELARDSLGARAFAASEFRRVALHWPVSPFAPKAILALLDLDPADADSLREGLLARYGESPYVVLAQGGDAPAYQVLEDSLRRFAANFRPEGRRAPARPGPAPARPTPAPPTPPREPADN